jgi:molybdopterin synthase catalytic subunit
VEDRGASSLQLNLTAITCQPIDVATLLREVSTPESGGIDLFVGKVRNHSGVREVRQLEYSAYVPMAEKLLLEIDREIRQQWHVHKVIMVHRIGLLQVGDIAVVTAVSAEHRDEAFAACRYAIDRIKSVVPIWKKEFFQEEAAWSPGQQIEQMTT